MNIFDRMESNVRSYCHAFPTTFQSAVGHELIDENGKSFIDFFAGAGVLNYGHNHPLLQEKLIQYITDNGVTHSLDMSTSAKAAFLSAVETILLNPRKMDYKVMFPGPTGTNAVESALKLARKVTGRTNVVAFTNGFHGMTLGSLALTGNSEKRAGAGVPLTDVSHVPFCNYFGTDTDTIDVLETYMQDNSSGYEFPAAFIVETVQAEGGVNVASREWMTRLSKIAKQVGALLIVDDIQVGCGRTGPFFSFENTDIEPDIICLSKSLSGYGLPFAINLLKPEYDIWEPGEHNGTFRGHNLAFVTATAALEQFWQDDELTNQVNRHAATLRDEMLSVANTYNADARGRGLIQGIEFSDPSIANKVSQKAFEKGLIIETSGPNGEVLKTLPPLTITDDALKSGVNIMKESIAEVMNEAESMACMAETIN